MCKNFIKEIACERKLGWICERLGVLLDSNASLTQEKRIRIIARSVVVCHAF